MGNWTRRDFLKVAGLATLGVPYLQAQPKSNKKRMLRIAHLTDIHVQPELAADQGMIACLHHVQNLKDKPDLIINGGDSIMDALKVDFKRTKLQWQLWQKILKDECSLPIKHCIGNHDVWGWHKESGADKKNAMYGKKWAMEMFALDQRYYSFDKAGWHFIVLDSTHSNEKYAYTAKLDKKQFAWLKKDLAAVKPNVPIMVISHIPILAACAYFDGENEKSGHWVVPGLWMHIDARQLKDLFFQYANVKLCISGHIHLLDRVDYNNITYLCNGSVCGKWWRGNYQECAPGYALIDLYEDGSFFHQYVTYGWKEKNAKKD